MTVACSCHADIELTRTIIQEEIRASCLSLKVGTVECMHQIPTVPPEGATSTEIVIQETCGAGERARSVQCLLDKHEDLSLIPVPREKLGTMVACTYNSSVREAELGRALKLCSPQTVCCNLVSQGSRRVLISKKEVEEGS